MSPDKGDTLTPATLPASPERLLQVLRGQLDPLYALLDAARDPRVLQLLRAGKDQYQSLYDGPEGEELARWAPYLVRLRPLSVVLQALVSEGWGQSWGVYLACSRPFAEVRSHFRRFLLVQFEDGEEVYFRFYDPRVLRLYLSTLAPEESKTFFGPVSCFLMEAEKPGILLRFTPD